MSDWLNSWDCLLLMMTLAGAALYGWRRKRLKRASAESWETLHVACTTSTRKIGEAGWGTALGTSPSRDAWKPGLKPSAAGRMARVALRVKGRKPRLHVHLSPASLMWGVAQSGSLEMMQLSFSASFNHDDRNQTLVIVDAYLKGTIPQLEMRHKFEVPPETMVDQRLVVSVTPVVGEKGKDWTGRVVLLDQFRRKYKLMKATFRWVGIGEKTLGRQILERFWEEDR
jgi:hypothetical protein